MAEVGREAGKYGRLNGQPALVALAARQHAVFSLTQLRGFGLTPSAVHKRVAVGRLHRVHHGVYSLLPPTLLSREGRFLAAVLACGPGAVLSHRSAAALHELRRTDRAGIDVTVPGRTSHSHDGIDVHRSTTLLPADTVEINRIPCTTIPRTLLDLAAVVGRRSLERALDQAEVLEALDAGALAAQIERNRATRAAKLLRAVLDEHRAGATATWSELEERFLALCRAARVPTPEVNAWITPGDGGPALRVDFLWRAQRLIVETDGHAFHATRQAFERDRRRDQRLTLAGWRVVRVTWLQLMREPRATARLLAELLDG